MPGPYRLACTTKKKGPSSRAAKRLIHVENTTANVDYTGVQFPPVPICCFAYRILLAAAIASPIRACMCFFFLFLVCVFFMFLLTDKKKTLRLFSELHMWFDLHTATRTSSDIYDIYASVYMHLIRHIISHFQPRGIPQAFVFVILFICRVPLMKPPPQKCIIWPLQRGCRIRPFICTNKYSFN